MSSGTDRTGENTRYVGRFAPSPTGPLHFGSLVAAVASFLDARHHGGTWLVRMEDLDPPREQAGADTEILRALESAGLEWDGPVLYQGTRYEAYGAALSRLADAGLSFPCGCTRREIGHGPYPGTCRDGLPADRQARSLRLRVDDEPVGFTDAVQG
ncbi:MAG: tRNA glutamyl-Q(34) synthetase GluQRS, partial [Gammaproteobacteria bacterium]|nr:tRNA glutamyl-Q(34) synthetase GluQRS [Gammaproteobacteria bacterium]